MSTLFAASLAVAGWSSSGSAQSGFDASVPIPVYVKAHRLATSSDDGSVWLTSPRDFEGLPLSGLVRLFVEPAVIHEPTGLRVFGAKRIEEAAEELRQAIEESPRLEIATGPDSADLSLTVTGATETPFWDEVYDQPAVFCVEFRVQAGDVSRSGSECRDDRPRGTSPVKFGLSIIFGPTSPSTERDMWARLAEQFVTKIEAWLGGEHPRAVAAVDVSFARVLLGELEASQQFARAASESDAQLVVEIVRSERRERHFDEGFRHVGRVVYRVEVAGNGFADESVESRGSERWSRHDEERLASAVVDKLEHWVRANARRSEAH
jgi:hypothetical protein